MLTPYRKSAESKKFSGELGSSKNAKLKCREFSKLQKREIKMQRKISVLQYYMTVNIFSFSFFHFCFFSVQYCEAD